MREAKILLRRADGHDEMEVVGSGGGFEDTRVKRAAGLEDNFFGLQVRKNVGQVFTIESNLQSFAFDFRFNLGSVFSHFGGVSEQS